MFAPDIRMSLYTNIQHDDLLCKVLQGPTFTSFAIASHLEKPNPAGPIPNLPFASEGRASSSGCSSTAISARVFFLRLLLQLETDPWFLFAVGKGKYSDAVCLSSIQFGHLRYHENMYLWSSDIRFCKIQTLFKEVALICNYGCASNRHAQICTRKQNSDKPWAPWTGDADTGVTWQLFTPICGIWNSLLSDPNNSILPLITVHVPSYVTL